MAKAKGSKGVPAVRGGSVALPADWMDEMSREAVEAQAFIPQVANRNISIRGGKFSLGGNLLEAPLNVVVLDFAFERSFYPEAFDPDNPSTPACWALSYRDPDGEMNMGPPADVLDRQSDKCFGCPKNAWASAGKGRRAKACGSKMRLALLEADVKDPEDAELAFIKVPSASLKNFAKYTRELSTKSNGKLALFGAVTAIDFDADAKYPMLTFKAVDEVKDGRLAAIILAQRKTTKEQLMQPFAKFTDDGSAAAVAPAARGVPKKRRFGK